MVAAIIQARMGSTRLPGKVLKNLNGKPLLKSIIDRINVCETVDKVLVATTVNPMDDELVNWCRANQIGFYRGDESNVLKRYYDAAKHIGADIIIRITADDPFKDPRVIDAVVRQLKENKLDFSFNNSPVSFPEGLDTEVFTFEAIKRAMEAETSDFENEHVTQYFYHNPELFKMMNYAYPNNLSKLRLTVDTEKDFELAEKIYQKLSPNGEMFYLQDILDLFQKEPQLVHINDGVKRSAMYE